MHQFPFKHSIHSITQNVTRNLMGDPKFYTPLNFIAVLVKQRQLFLIQENIYLDHFQMSLKMIMRLLHLSLCQIWQIRIYSTNSWKLLLIHQTINIFIKYSFNHLKSDRSWKKKNLCNIQIITFFTLIGHFFMQFIRQSGIIPTI